MSKELERTDVFQGEFSPTGIQTAACYRRFYFEKILKLRAVNSTIPLNFGTAFHAAVETFYRMRKEEAELDAIKIAAAQTFAEEWSAFGMRGDGVRNLHTGLLAIGRYCETYQFDRSIFELADIECTQWLPMNNGTRILVKLDRVISTPTMIRLVDTKTTSSALTDYFFLKFDNDFQMSCYYYVVEQLLGGCDDIQIDAVRLPAKDDMCFTRRSFMRTELQIQDMLNTYYHVSEYIMKSLEVVKEKEDPSLYPTVFYCNQSECDKFGGCKYRNICKFGLDHPSTKVDFYVEGEEPNEDAKICSESSQSCPVITSGGRTIA